MITNKDIRVENGSLILNGDPYPLDGQSPAAIMQIVEDNSDSTPTENSTAPVTSGGVYTALGAKQDTLTFDNAPTQNSNNPVKSGGTYTALAGKIDSVLNTYSTSALNVDDTFQIPSEMLDRKILIISANRAAWTGSVIVTTGQIKAGDCGNGVKLVTGDRSDPTVDKYIILTISSTGLITVKYINNWSAPYLVLNAL